MPFGFLDLLGVLGPVEDAGNRVGPDAPLLVRENALVLGGD